jgi:hypothetical protein
MAINFVKISDNPITLLQLSLFSMLFNRSTLFILTFILLLLGNNTAVALHQLEHMDLNEFVVTDTDDLDELCDDASHHQGASANFRFEFSLTSHQDITASLQDNSVFIIQKNTGYAIRAPPLT